MITINEYLLSKTNNKANGSTSIEELIDNLPSTINVGKNELKKEFSDLIEKGYFAESAVPFYEANKYTACFYLFYLQGKKNEYALVSICSRKYHGDNFEYPIITYTNNRNAISLENDKEIIVLMNWGTAYGNKRFNMQEMVQIWLDKESFGQYDSYVHKHKWYCKAKFYTMSSFFKKEPIYNAVSFYK